VQLEEDPRELPLFERAVHLYQALGNVPREAESSGGADLHRSLPGPP
jgi:hypothetical protein